MALSIEIIDQTSKPVSELDAISSVRQSDAFVVQRNDESYSLQYKDLLNQILNEISSQLNLQSMAFMDKDDYAKANHSHDYSTFHVFPYTTFSDLSALYPSGTNPHDVNEYIGTFVQTKNNGEAISIDVFTPYFQKVDVEVPYIGEMRLMATSDALSNMMYDDMLCGWWAIPNGQTIQCGKNEFVDACKIYGNNLKDGNDISFTVPLISGFIKLNPGQYKQNSLEYVDYNNGSLAAHTHEFDNSELSSNAVLSTTVQICVHGDKIIEKVPDSYERISTGSAVVHAGQSSNADDPEKISDLVEFSSDISVDLIGSVPSYTDQISIDIETKPYSNNVGALIYIGRK